MMQQQDEFSGDRTVLDFVSQPTNDLTVLRARLSGVYVQFIASCFFAALFLHNARVVARCLRACPHSPSTWCIAIQAGLGVLYGFVVLYGLMLPFGLTCRQVSALSTSMIAAVTVCSNLVLVLKANAACQNNRWLLYTGLLLSCLGPTVMVVQLVGFGASHFTASGGCTTRYPSYFPWIKLVLDAPVNIVFSAVFLRVALRQYREVGTHFWYILSRDGLWFMCAIALTNLVCALAVALRLAGELSDMFIAIDWLITSTLLVYHVKRLRGTMKQQCSRAPHSISRERLVPPVTGRPSSLPSLTRSCSREELQASCTTLTGLESSITVVYLPV